ncbi:DUF3488 and DUF4129 domain-containing transglutaminase family protein [Microbacterium sp. NPDC091313]
MSAESRALARTLPGRRRTDLLLAIGVFVAVLAAVLPLLRVIHSGAWLPGALVTAAAVLATGFGARWLRLPGVAVALLELAVWVALLTAMFGGGTALLWVIPTPQTLSSVPTLFSAATSEIALGAAPLTAGMPLAFLLVAAIGLVAVAIDHVVITARMPLLAAIGLIAVSLVPSIAVPGDVDLVAFVLLAAAVLFLLRVDTRARQRPGLAAARDAGEAPIRTSGATATALGIGAVAVIVTVVAAPLLPAPLARAGSGGIGGGSTIDPTLQLGDDLRQPRETQVLSVTTTAPTAPYLRAVTLSRFDGAVWQPDEGRALPLDASGALPAAEAIDPAIETTEYRTEVQVDDLDSPWLPVSYPATTVTGLDGDWSALPENRTVTGQGVSTRGQTYEVTSTVPRPTLEQIRARAAGGDVDQETLALPDGMPAIIAETAQEVTADAQSDYDRLVKLQSYFRSTQFSYSLDAPVDEGFDGSGADAVAQFLDRKAGYCVHYASAFALMARTLGMPARIVVGYLPGTGSNSIRDGETVFTVSSSQLHSWPEVHFDGIGWVAFEPTNSLGVPTSFTSGSTPGSATPGSTTPLDPSQQSAAPETNATTAPRLPDEPQAGAGGGSVSGPNPWPGIGLGALAIAVLVLPSVLGELQRRRRHAAARSGDGGAAWLALQELAIDLGIAVAAAESPRAFARRLERAHGGPPDALAVLVTEIERASYAGGRTRSSDGVDLAGALAAVESGLRSTAAAPRRMLARALPFSLAVRPGSALAHPAEPAPAT